MATITLPEAEVKEQKKSTTKYVYSFGGGKADGNGKMKDVLGGKGAGLAEMTNAGLPVPPGFTIQTEACREYMRGGLSPEINKQMDEALAKLEALQGQKLGTGENPSAGKRAFGREVLDAGHDGHDSESRLERRERAGAGEAEQQSSICGRFLSPFDSDVRQRGARHREVRVR